MLVLENGDMALSNHAVILEASGQALVARLDQPDEIWLVDTTIKNEWTVMCLMRDGVLFPDDQTAVRHRDGRSKPDQAIGWGRTDVPDSINVKGSTTRSRRRQAELETRGVFV